MKAIGIREFGGIEKLEVLEIPRPPLGRGEVLMKIEYAALNPVDGKIREGHLKALMPHRLPIILGWDAAGVVAEVGAGVSRFKVGDRIFAYCRKNEVAEGSFAEFIALNESNVALIPENLKSEQMAAVSLTVLTAWQALVDFAGIRSGFTVFVTAGSGGVGSFAVQIAKLMGARVAATASQRNLEYLKKLGVDVPIDYTEGDVVSYLKARFPEGIDTVFDCKGGKSLEEAWGIVKSGGTVVSIVEEPQSKDPSVKSGFVFVAPNGEQLSRIASFLSKGEMKFPTIQVDSLKNIKKCMAELEKGHTQGKVVLRVEF